MTDRWEPVARATRARVEQSNRNADNILALVAARRRIAELEATVERVRALHAPEKRWLPWPDADVSFDTEEEAADYDDGAGPYRHFLVCAACKAMEDSPDDGEATRHLGYRDSLWPCPTIRALDHPYEGESRG